LWITIFRRYSSLSLFSLLGILLNYGEFPTFITA